MRTVSSALRPLVLAVACLLLAASVAEANPRQRLFPPTVVYSLPAPVYTPGVRVAPSVYVYPQVITTPRYYSAYPSYYPYGYPMGWYGGSTYTPGSFYYRSSPRGTSYYYTNPSFSYWYRVR